MCKTASRTEYFSMASGEEHLDDSDGGSGCAPTVDPRRESRPNFTLWGAGSIVVLALAYWFGSLHTATQQEVEDLRSELLSMKSQMVNKEASFKPSQPLLASPASNGGPDRGDVAGSAPPRPTPRLPEVTVQRVPVPQVVPPDIPSGEWPPPVRAAAPLQEAERYAGTALGTSPSAVGDEPRVVKLRPGLKADEPGGPKPERKAEAKPNAKKEAGKPQEQGRTKTVSRSGHEEFACVDAPRSQWDEVRSAAVRQLGGWSAATKVVAYEELSGLLSFAVEQLQAFRSNNEECSLGRLCMSVLAIITTEDGGSLHTVPSLQIPLLHALLEVPWAVTFSSGWPLFALLSQLHQRSHGIDDMPKAGGSLAEYLSKLRLGLEKRQPEALAKAGAALLGHDGSGGQRDPGEEVHAMPMLCALASQLLGDDLQPGEEANTAIAYVQGFFSTSVQSIDDLHASVISAWPLFGILHAAVVKLTESSAKAAGR